jgi:hypothetical protein
MTNTNNIDRKYSNVTEINKRSDAIKNYSWSASKYSLETLEECSHEYDLWYQVYDKQSIHVNIDSMMTGLGGYDSWTPNIGQSYLIYPQSNMTVEMVLIPFTGSANNEINNFYNKFVHNN